MPRGGGSRARGFRESSAVFTLGFSSFSQRRLSEDADILPAVVNNSAPMHHVPDIVSRTTTTNAAERDASQ